MKVFLASIYAQILLNSYTFLRGWQAIPPKNIWRIPFIIIYAAELLLFFTGFFFHKYLPDEAMVLIYNVCGAWYISLLYATMLLFGIEILRLSERCFHWIPSRASLYGKRVKPALFFLVISIVVILMANGYRAVMNPTVKNIYLNLPKGEGNPRDSLKILMMSDIHIGEIITKKQVELYASIADSLKPDIIVLPGDILDYDLHSAYKYHIDTALKKLNAPLGIYAVNGNHEYRANRFSKWEWIKSCNITLLKDSAVMIDSSFYLLGRDDYINKKRQPLQALVKNLDRSKTIIMLDHQPYSFVEASMNDIPLSLYGHTHNGQFWPYSLIMRLVYECPYGLHRRGKSQFYVSSGTGVAGPPYRIGTVSEIVLLHICFFDKSNS